MIDLMLLVVLLLSVVFWVGGDYYYVRLHVLVQGLSVGAFCRDNTFSRTSKQNVFTKHAVDDESSLVVSKILAIGDCSFFLVSKIFPIENRKSLAN